MFVRKDLPGPKSPKLKICRCGKHGNIRTNFGFSFEFDGIGMGMSILSGCIKYGDIKEQYKESLRNELMSSSLPRGTESMAKAQAIADWNNQLNNGIDIDPDGFHEFSKGVF